MAQPPGMETRALPVARHQRPQHQAGSAHRLHQFVGRFRPVQFFGTHGHAVAIHFQSRAPVCSSNCSMVPISRTGGNAIQHHRLVGEQAGGQRGKRGILRAADRDLAFERRARLGSGICPCYVFNASECCPPACGQPCLGGGAIQIQAAPSRSLFSRRRRPLSTNRRRARAHRPPMRR